MLAPARPPLPLGLLLGFHVGRAERRSLAQHAGATIIEFAQKGWPHRDASHCERITAVRAPGIVNMTSATLRPEAPGGRNGVRTRLGARLTPGNWRIYWCERAVIGTRRLFDPLHADQVAAACAGMEYDLWGSVASAVLRLRQDPDRVFCSEIVADMIGLPEPWSYHPARLEALVAACGRVVTRQVFDGSFHLPTANAGIDAPGLDARPQEPAA